MRNGFATLLQLVQFNFGQILYFTLQDSAGVTVDVSNATVAFICQSDSDYPVQGGGAMQVINATNGRVSYTVSENDFLVSGTWRAQIVVTYDAGEVQTFDGITITVNPALPLS